jgi:type I restriction enzyme S subunit
MIPEHWDVKRVKELCSLVSRGATPDYVDDSEFKVMSQAVFRTGNLNRKVVRFSSYMKPDSQIKKGDLLIASTGGGVLGKLYYYDDEDKDFYADTHVTIVRNDKGSFYTKFLFYLLSYQFDMINACMAKGSTNQTELQRDSLLSYELALPPLEEQQTIVAYLDEKCAKTDAAIANIDKQTDALKRLKRSLINEVITGQRAV